MSLLSTRIAIFFVFIQPLFLNAQRLADPCFSSSPQSNTPIKTRDLISLNGDLLDWDGSKWLGQWPVANVVVTPPMPEFCDKPVRAVWLGSGTQWQSNGEGFSFRLETPLSAGTSYTFKFYYISEGAGNDNAFAPEFSTSLFGDHIGFVVGRLKPAGRIWHYDSISFVAVPFQHGDQWITLHTRASGSSGLILAPCPQQKFRISQGGEPCFGHEVELKGDRYLSNHLWSTGEDTGAVKIGNSGIYWLESVSPCGIHRDTVEIEFKDCGAGVGLPPPKVKGGGINLPKIRINFNICWFGNCDDDDDVPDGPPSPEVTIYNVVTPNGDGLNDVFYVGNVERGSWKLRIFNRWGELVFEDLKYQNTWNPSDVPAGAYFFVLKDRNSDVSIKGVVTIIH